MQLREHILQIRDALKSGSFLNEASISQGVVLRLLQALDWPVFDSKIVCPEYVLGGGRVDFALCHPPRKPLVIVEVKKIGQMEGADQQVFEYAFHAGVPMAIVTDGQEWHFYLPAEQGNYQERRVYKLDIIDRDLSETESRLQRYLDYSACTTGKALEAARLDYRDVSRKREIDAVLPQAWQQLVQEQDETLLELLSAKVEDICGFRPDLDTVAHFLSAQPTTQTSQMSERLKQNPTVRTASNTSVPRTAQSLNETGFVLSSQNFSATSAKDVMIKLFQQLALKDKTFLERFAARPLHGRKRRFVARNQYELYPGRPDLCEVYSYELIPGWWIGTNYSKQTISKIISMAADVAGISVGQDLQFNLD